MLNKLKLSTKKQQIHDTNSDREKKIAIRYDHDDDYHGDEANVLNDIHVLVYVCVLKKKKKRIVDGHQKKEKSTPTTTQRRQ